MPGTGSTPPTTVVTSSSSGAAGTRTLSGPERLEQEAADLLLHPPEGWARDFYARPAFRRVQPRARRRSLLWKGWIVGPVNTPRSGKQWWSDFPFFN